MYVTDLENGVVVDVSRAASFTADRSSITRRGTGGRGAFQRYRGCALLVPVSSDQTRPHHAIMPYHVRSCHIMPQPMPCHVMQSATLIGRYKWQRHRSKVLAGIGVIVLSNSYNYED